MKTDNMGGIIYGLRFASDAQPAGFLADLSKKVHDGARQHGPTRTGQFHRMSVFSSGFNEVVDGKVIPHVEYLFVVAGNMHPLPWLTSLLETYGTVSFPLGEREWSWRAEDDMTAA